MKILSILFVAIIASASGFVIHVTTVEWLPQWISNQMQGLEIKPSWDVKYVALMTSIEYGLAAIALYHCARSKLIIYGRLGASILFAALLAAINGALFRQPLMDFLIGNPINVVLVQNLFKWLVWLFMSLVVIFGYEALLKSKSKSPNQV